MPHRRGFARLLARSSVMSTYPLPPSSPSAYGVVVPVKPPAVAKSRLRPLGDEARAELVVAFAVDTVMATLAASTVGRVLVVTDDHRLAAGMAALGVDVIPDGTSEDLNGSLVQAAAELRRRSPGLGVAALCADLPALRSEELDRALEDVADGLSFVADADGVGTTMVAAPSLASFRPRFGSGSRQRHLDAGAHEIAVADVPTLRRDVDTPSDLHAARRLGLGSRTSMVLAGLRL